MAMGGLSENLVDDIIPLMAVLNHAIDSAPVGQAAKVAIVDKHIDLEFAREMGIIIGGLFGIIAINGIELETVLATPFDSIFQQFALTYRPHDDAMAILTKHLQGVNGEGDFLADFRIFVGYYRSVEIYCYCHIFSFLRSVGAQASKLERTITITLTITSFYL